VTKVHWDGISGVSDGTDPHGAKMTDPTLARGWITRSRRIVGWLTCLAAVTTTAAATAFAQPVSSSAQCPQTTAALYTRLRSVELDPNRVYRIREASIDRPNLHIDFEDGTLAFTEDICGRTTGAFFEGEAEVRLRPPSRVERASLALFTGMAILEEQFTTGYLRFNDDTANALQPYLSPAPDGQEFIKEWSDTSRILTDTDSLRLLLDFSHFLPTSDGSEPERKFPPFLHAHLLGKKLGGFDVYWDASAPEPLWAGQPKLKDETIFFDIWTSFAPTTLVKGTAAPLVGDVSITDFHIRASVQPPTRLQATTEADVRVRSGGERALLFELSRYLKIDSIEVDGRPVDFLQNQALEGSKLQRKGNDLVAVVFPAPLAAGEDLKLHFSYTGDVLSEAGNGLLYVGERGTWYPNFGLSPAQFDMEFRYPADWTLVATGKQTWRAGDKETEMGPEMIQERFGRWISERPIPVAGFNLGKYVRADAKAGDIPIAVYGTNGVEKSFPKAQAEIIESPTASRRPGDPAKAMGSMVIVPPPPSPARDVQSVADRAARSIESYSRWFGPYPYGSLAFTQMPGQLSQGWPSLVFLSSFAFLNPQEQTDLRLDPVMRVIDNQVIAHETAHQWWGDFVFWQSYRDQWIGEGLANYSSLLILEQQNPAQFRAVMDKYRHDLLSKNKDGEWLRDAGPVTLGQRLDSSHFPGGYEAISYERGTWLFHMLRCMMRDAAISHVAGARDSEMGSQSRKGKTDPDEPFFRTLRKVRERYAGKALTTQDLVEAFEEQLPRPLWFENRRKLDWFLRGWIEGTAIPELGTQEIHIVPKAAGVTVTGVIVQKDAPDDLVTAVPVYGATTGNTLVYLGEVLADGAETAFRLSGPANLRKIVLDPKQTVLTSADKF